MYFKVFFLSVKISWLNNAKININQIYIKMFTVPLLYIIDYILKSHILYTCILCMIEVVICQKYSALLSSWGHLEFSVAWRMWTTLISVCHLVLREMDKRSNLQKAGMSGENMIKKLHTNYIIEFYFLFSSLKKLSSREKIMILSFGWKISHVINNKYCSKNSKELKKLVYWNLLLKDIPQVS